MTKLQQSITSLIAVIPAAILVYLLVMVVLSHSENLSTIAYVVVGGTLVSAVVTLLIPAGIMVGGRKKPASAPAKPASKGKSSDDEDIEAIDEDVEVSDSSSASFDAQDVLAESSEYDLGDSDQDMLGHDSDAEVDTEPVEDFEDFDIEEEEEPKPKKKRR